MSDRLKRLHESGEPYTVIRNDDDLPIGIQPAISPYFSLRPQTIEPIKPDLPTAGLIGSVAAARSVRGRLSRRGLIGGAVAGALLAPKFSEAATNFLWSGAGSYNAGPTSWLTTELNTLANSAANTLSTLGAAFQNTSSWVYADVEFVAGGTFTPLAGGFLELWHLRSLDGGTNYEDGTASIAPGRSADIVIPVRAGTTITPRAGNSGLIMPPAFFKPIARNQTGATLPATSNVARASFYVEQF